MDLYRNVTIVWFCTLLVGYLIYFVIHYIVHYFEVEVTYENVWKEVFRKKYLISIFFKLLVFVAICVVTGVFPNLCLIVDGEMFWKKVLVNCFTYLLAEFTFRCQCLAVRVHIRPGL